MRTVAKVMVGFAMSEKTMRRRLELRVVAGGRRRMAGLAVAVEETIVADAAAPEAGPMAGAMARAVVAARADAAAVHR